MTDNKELKEYYPKRLDRIKFTKIAKESLFANKVTVQKHQPNPRQLEVHISGGLAEATPLTGKSLLKIAQSVPHMLEVLDKMAETRKEGKERHLASNPPRA